MQPGPSDELRPSRESRLITALFKLDEKMQDLKSAASDEDFEKWQSTWSKQSKQIEQQLKMIESQLEVENADAGPKFSVVGTPAR